MTTLLRLLEPSSTDLKATEESSKPIILIVDEFDLFALHPRQSFLYCLLDIVQGNRRRGGVGVVGVSSRVVSRLHSPIAIRRRALIGEHLSNRIVSHSSRNEFDLVVNLTSCK